MGAAHRQHRQAGEDARVRREQERREDRLRLENGIAEILSAAQDVLSGVQILRQAHERRTMPRYYLRLAATLMRDCPVLEKPGDLLDVRTLKPLVVRRWKLIVSRSKASGWWPSTPPQSSRQG
jgi:hypothetical protein